MEAYKCDRCGKLYERQVEKILYVGKKGEGPLDLCPQCTESFEEWWEAGKEQNNDT